MASNITSDTIDATYPVAGVDNDTQGFRDNFGIIKQNFQYAATEITDLQNNTARLDSSSNFQGSHIIDAQFETCTESFIAKGNFASGSEISFTEGRYQTIGLSLPAETPSATFQLSNWPSTEDENRLAKITVEIKLATAGDSKTVEFTSEGGGTIKKNSSWPGTVTIGSTNPTIFEFWSYDGGETVYAEYKGLFS
jgi:hypothetical protein